MRTIILDFIRIFNSPSNQLLFTETACYWFAVILHQRFPNSSIVYDPDLVHFATKIENTVYDITGIIENAEDYIDWEFYSASAEDTSLIVECCIKLKGGGIS